MSEIMLKVSHVSKEYKLGQIGGTTSLRKNFIGVGQSGGKQDDPTRKIGSSSYLMMKNSWHWMIYL